MPLFTNMVGCRSFFPANGIVRVFIVHNTDAGHRGQPTPAQAESTLHNASGWPRKLINLLHIGRNTFFWFLSPCEDNKTTIPLRSGQLHAHGGAIRERQLFFLSIPLAPTVNWIRSEFLFSGFNLCLRPRQTTKRQLCFLSFYRPSSFSMPPSWVTQ